MTAIVSKGWQPLQPANLVRNITEQDIREAMAMAGIERTEAMAGLEAELAKTEYWIIDLYQVALRRLASKPPMIHLNIRRRDGKVILRDWRHFQWIKNQLVGEECEAVEIYPAESRLADTSNKYHLWCFDDPNFRLPFGLEGREVVTHAGGTTPGLRQRPL